MTCMLFGRKRRIPELSPAEEVEALSAMACEAMSDVAEFTVPFEVGVASGPDWASAK